MANLNKEFKSDIIRSAMLPLLFLLLCFLVFGYESAFEVSLHQYGLKPRDFKGLRGVLFMPFLHGDLEHLLNNSFGVLVLGTLLFLGYKEIALQVFLMIFFLSGLWTWTLAFGGTHIGASAGIYGLFSFLALSGLLRKDVRLMAITFLVIFAHQGMVWGIFPTKPGISWEGHLSGFLAGIVLAIYYKKEGPQPKRIILNDDDSFNEMRFGKYYWDEQKRKEEEGIQQQEIKIIYHIKKEGEI